MRWIAMLSALLLAGVLGLGCGSSESDLPDVSAGVEDAARATADAVEKAAETTRDAVDKAADATSDAARDAAEDVEEEIED